MKAGRLVFGGGPSRPPQGIFSGWEGPLPQGIFSGRDPPSLPLRRDPFYVFYGGVPPGPSPGGGSPQIPNSPYKAPKVLLRPLRLLII